MQGDTFTLKADAIDDVEVASVTFVVNGQEVFTTDRKPYHTDRKLYHKTRKLYHKTRKPYHTYRKLYHKNILLVC